MKQLGVSTYSTYSKWSSIGAPFELHYLSRRENLLRMFYIRKCVLEQKLDFYLVLPLGDLECNEGFSWQSVISRDRRAIAPFSPTISTYSLVRMLLCISVHANLSV